MIGNQIAHYRILRRLGGGGMGEVFCAEDTRLGRQVALKFLHPELLSEHEARQRFVFEARAVAILNHPNITTLYEFDPDHGFMSLEYVPGSNLEERLATGALSAAEAVRIGLAVCRALGHAHGRSVVHRDIKPSNILLGEDGAIKLTDFGIAQRRDLSTRASADAMAGTGPYMCPEQVRGQRIDGRGDLFSFGVVLYRSLCGRLPWSSEGLAALYAVQHETPAAPIQLRADLPGALSLLVERLLRKEPAERFASAEEVEKHLLEVEERLARSGAEGRATIGEPLGEGVEVAPTTDRLADETGAARPAAIPGRLPFVGREREFALLQGALDKARLGSGSTVLVEGEAGLGKSRLMEEFRDHAETTGLLCLGGRCSFHGGRNFEPFIEALEEFARRSRPGSEGMFEASRPAPALPGKLFSTLNMLLDPTIQVEPRSREQLWYLLDSVLKRIAEREPLVVFLDDLHWADEGTLSLLNHVTRNLGGSRLLLVGSFRPEELRAAEGEHPLAEVIRLLAPVETLTRLPLEPLGAAETASLVDAALEGVGLGTSMVATVHKRAQGNPFFTIEILRLLDETRVPGEAPAPQALDTLALPRNVSDVLTRRLARLSAEERDVLDLAAVEGESFHTDILEAGVGVPRIALLKLLRGLHQAHHLVVPTDEGHRFAHGLVREVVLRAIPSELSREYHRVVADGLMRGYHDRADYARQMGYHLFEARRFAEALPFLLGAAREARRLFVNDRALGFCERALEAQAQAEVGAAARRAEILRLKCEVLLDLGRPEAARAAASEAMSEERGRGDEPGMAACEEWLGEAALAQGDLAAAETLLEGARARYETLGEALRVARCDRRLGALAARRGDFEQALARLDGARATLARIGDAHEEALVRVEAGEVLHKQGAYDRALESFEAAVADLRRLGDRHGVATGLTRQGNALFQSGRADLATARYEEALAVAIEAGDVQGMARLQANLGNVHLVRGDADRALRSYEEALKRFQEIGDQRGSSQILVALGNVCFARGQFAAAARHYGESLAPREAMGDRWGLANSLDNLGAALYWLGRFGEARERARAALALRAELGDRPGLAESALNLGSLDAVLGEVDEAARRFAEAGRLAGELGDPRKAARARLAEAVLALWSGDRAGARRLLPALDAPGLEEPQLRSRRLLLEGLLAERAGGEEALKEALHEAVRSGSIPEQAIVRLALARISAEEGRSDQALAHWNEAFALVGEGRVPLLELHALRIGAALGPAPGPAGPGAEERARVVAGELAARLPDDLPRRPDFARTPFPLP